MTILVFAKIFVFKNMLIDSLETESGCVVSPASFDIV